MIDVILKQFEDRDETRIMEKGRFEIVRLGCLTVGRATYEPGWKWSVDVGPGLGQMHEGHGGKGELNMALTRDEAWQHLCEWTETDSLRKHARSVELVMRQAAHRYGAGVADEEQWGIAGMLHDADYEKWPQDHPNRIVAWLRERGEEEIAHAVSAHFTKWGVPYENSLDKALLACDELTGFVGACCLVRPDGIRSLTPKSVRKKLKDKAFAAKVDRGEIQAGVELLGVEPAEHYQFIIDSLAPHADELGIGGRGQG